MTSFTNDILGELSDGSDSFFDDPKLTAKRSSIPKTPSKKSINDLFNLKDDETVGDKKTDIPSKKVDDWLGLEATPKKSPLRKRSSFKDVDDLFAPKKDEKDTKKNILDILGGPKTEEKKITFDDILKESKASKIVQETPKTADLPQLSVEAPREGRRGRRPSTPLADPLGLFSTEPKPEDSSKKISVQPKEEVRPTTTQTKSVPNLHTQGLPDWLDTQPLIKPNKSEIILTKTTTKTEEPEQKLVEDSDLSSVVTQQRLINSNLEYQNTSIALQQQESQVLMALQLKKYDENMGEIQRQQQKLLLRQEQQFNNLLERQFAKQQIIENNLRLQQERINNHIQLLVSQPHISKTYGTDDDLNEVKKSMEEEHVSILKNMQIKHKEEMFLMEELYKNQISLLEENVRLIEDRLRTNLSTSNELYEEKITEIQKQHKVELDKQRVKFEEMEQQHLEEIRSIKESHSRIIDEIKSENGKLIENLKTTKQQENLILQNSDHFSQKLQLGIELLNANSRNLEDMRLNVEESYGVLTKAREESLKAKEEEIRLMKNTLEKCRESAEQERAQLLSLVRNLEIKIAEQNQNGREDRWAFQQATAVLTAKAAAFEREMEFSRASIEREREQLKTLKESMLKEQETMMLQLTEERMRISGEKARLNVVSKLNANVDSQKAQIEIDAALQVAKEASERTDKEREVLIRKQADVEKLKRQLIDQENKLILKERELEDMIDTAETKAREGERAMRDSKSLENKYNEQLRELQGQLVSLSNREKKLAEEKIGLSKERLALYTMLRQTKKCGLCAADGPKLDVFDNHLPKIYDVDQDILRLRMEVSENENDEVNSFRNELETHKNNTY